MRARAHWVALVIVALAASGCGANGAPPGATAGTGGAATLPENGSPCTSNADCSQPTPLCDAKRGHCVQCNSNTNCPVKGMLCRLADRSCVHCLSAGDCPPTRPYCSVAGSCVECISTTNCGSPKSACNPTSHLCVPTCASEADCTSDTRAPHCDADAGRCAECVTDADCLGRLCLQPGGVCVACLSDGDCPPEQPICSSTHTCVMCRTSADCSPGHSCVGSVCST